LDCLYLRCIAASSFRFRLRFSSAISRARFDMDTFPPPSGDTFLPLPPRPPPGDFGPSPYRPRSLRGMLAL
jgi:hypothetical protein